MKKSSGKIIWRVIFVLILLLSGYYSVKAQSTPTSQVEMELDPEPQPLIPGAPAILLLDLSVFSSPECSGIPGKPMDFYLAVANSGQDNETVFASHKKIVSSFIDANFVSSDQVSHSRFILLNDETSSIPTIEQNSLVASLTKLRRQVSGNAPALVKRALGLQLEVQQLTPDNKPNQPVLVLFFNNLKQIDQNVLKPLFDDAAKQGFKIALVFMAKSEQEKPTISYDTVSQLVMPENFLSRPNESVALRKFFVQLTDGKTDWAAQDINIIVTTVPVDALFSAQLGINRVGINGLSFRRIDHLISGESYKEGLLVEVNPTLIEDELPLVASVDYLDCNGILKQQSFIFSLDVDKNVHPSPTFTPVSSRKFTPTPDVLPTTDGTLAPNEKLTPRPEDIQPIDGNTAQSTPGFESGGVEPVIPPTTPPIVDSGGIITFLSNLPNPFGSWFASSILPLITTIWAAVEPVLLWIFLAILILLLLWFLWWLMKKWFNRPKTPIQPVTPPPPPRFDVLDCIPAWYKNLRSETPESIVIDPPAVPEFSETLLIGIGPVGREILSQMATVLNSRWGDRWRKNIHLLQVDVKMPGANLGVPSGMTEREWVLWTPNFEEIKDMLLNANTYRVDVAHWEWYHKTAVEEDSRAIGRMAFFDDLRNGRGKFWNALVAAYQGFTDPNIRIIGATFDNISSGVLIDIARITSLITNKVDMQLWLAGAFQEDWKDYSNKQPLTSDEQKLRTLATLREIERSQIGSRMLYAYVPKNNLSGQLKQYFDDSVTQRVLLFEQRDKSQETKTDVFDSMLDALLVMLHKEVSDRVSRKLQDSSVSAGKLLRSGNGIAIAVGTYSFHLTLGLVEMALTWRMVRDLFFEQEYGLKPLEKCEQDGAYKKLDTLNPPSIHVVNERELIEDWLIKLEKTQSIESFVTHVADRLNKILNGELVDGISNRMLARQYAFEQAERWLKVLEACLREDGRTQLARQTVEFQKEIASWNLWLERELYPICVANLKQAQDKLQRLRSRSRRESDIPESLEWATYIEDIRPNKTKQRIAADKMPLLKYAERFGWQVVYELDEWHLRFIMPPRSFGYDDKENKIFHANSLVRFTLNRRDANNFAAMLYDLAYPYTLVGKTHYNATEVLAAQVKKGASLSGWLDKSEPGLQFNKTVASNSAAGRLDEMTTLAAPKESNSDAIQPLLDALVSAGQMGEEQKTEDLLSNTGNDTEMVGLLKLIYWIPFNDLKKMYDREQRIPASYYVWPSEQLTSEIEKSVNYRFSNLFISRLAQDYEWVSAFGLALIYGLFGFDGEKWDLPGWPPSVKAESHWDLLLKTLDIDDLQHPRPKRQEVLDLWESSVSERRDDTRWLKEYNVGSRYEWLSQAEDDYVKPFRRKNTNDVIAEDWAVFLGYLINQEKTK